MAEEFDLEDVGVDEAMAGDDRLRTEGSYHFVVKGIEEGGGHDNQKLVLTMVVLSPGPNQGALFMEYVPENAKPGNKKTRLKLAVLLGVVTLEAVKQAKAEGGSLMFEWQKGVGKEVCGKVWDDSYKKKDDNDQETGEIGHSYCIKWSTNFWSPEDTKANEKMKCKLGSGDVAAAAATGSCDAAGEPDIPF